MVEVPKEKFFEMSQWLELIRIMRKEFQEKNIPIGNYKPWLYKEKVGVSFQLLNHDLVNEFAARIDKVVERAVINFLKAYNFKGRSKREYVNDDGFAVFFTIDIHPYIFAIVFSRVPYENFAQKPVIQKQVQANVA